MGHQTDEIENVGYFCGESDYGKLLVWLENPQLWVE
jgi:hypothetical protein